jgi:site-specific DNA recombinase
VNHKGTLFPGEHEAIIERATWERAQDMLDSNGRTNGGGAKNKYGALLRGLLFCVPCGTRWCTPTRSRNSKRYRYYVCYNAQQRGWKNCRTKSVSAQAVETAVLDSHPAHRYRLEAGGSCCCRSPQSDCESTP